MSAERFDRIIDELRDVAKLDIRGMRGTLQGALHEAFELGKSDVVEYAVELRGLLADARDALRYNGIINPTALLRHIDAALAKNPNPSGHFATEASLPQQGDLVIGEASGLVGLGPDKATRYCKHCELPIDDIGDEERCPLKPASELTAEMLEDVRTVLRGFDEGVFIRDVAHDAESGWAMKLLPFMRALGRLSANVENPPAPVDARTVPLQGNGDV